MDDKGSALEERRLQGKLRHWVEMAPVQDHSAKKGRRWGWDAGSLTLRTYTVPRQHLSTCREQGMKVLEATGLQRNQEC